MRFFIPRGFVSMLVLAAMLAGGCAAPGQPNATELFEPGATYYAKLVTDLADPSMEGRAPGTPGIDRARNYIVDHLERSGLQPAFDDSYGQPLEITLGTHATMQSLAFAAADQTHRAQAAEDFQALGLSPNGPFEGQAVFVGYGVTADQENYDAYKNLSADALAGKVAIVFRYEPMTDNRVSQWTDRAGRWTDAAHFDAKANRAAAHGAVALLVVDPPSRPLSGVLRTAQDTTGLPGATIPVMHITQSLLERMVRAAHRHPKATLRQWQQAADQGPVFDPLTGLTVSGEVELASRKAMTQNVAAVLPGCGTLAQEIVFIAAHYDHLGYGEVGSRSGTKEIHHGADDNASGTAGVLLLAKRYAQRYRTDDADRRTIVFALFTAEERGLLGSAYMMDHLAQMNIDVGKIVAMLNMDMIGRSSDNKFYVLGLGTADQWDALVTAANEKVGFDLITQPWLPGNSDHVHFANRDVPSLHFFSGFHADYHMPTDTAEKINVDGALRGLRLVDAVLEVIVTQDTRMAFTGAGQPGGHAAAIGDEAGPAPAGGVRLGIMPDYATTFGLDGAGVAEVLSEPALSAGLEKGDLIVQWNDTPIGNVEHLSTMLSRSQAGDKVKLTVLRGNERKEIELTLVSR